MGGLHQGHVRLMEVARSSSAGSTLLSLFVNPLQFGPNEDYDRYPRTLQSDLALAESAGVDAVWAPDIGDVFPDGPEDSFGLTVPALLQSNLCGRVRPGLWKLCAR